MNDHSALESESPFTRCAPQSAEMFFGLTPQSFTYPFGQETAGADAILKDLGIQASFNSREEVARLRRGHPEDLYSIGRFCRDGRISTEAFLARWEQSAGFAESAHRRYRQRHCGEGGRGSCGHFDKRK